MGPCGEEKLNSKEEMESEGGGERVKVVGGEKKFFSTSRRPLGLSRPSTPSRVRLRAPFPRRADSRLELFNRTSRRGQNRGKWSVEVSLRALVRPQGVFRSRPLAGLGPC